MESVETEPARHADTRAFLSQHLTKLQANRNGHARVHCTRCAKLASRRVQLLRYCSCAPFSSAWLLDVCYALPTFTLVYRQAGYQCVSCAALKGEYAYAARRRMSLQSALIGFLIGRSFTSFTPQENVVIQTTAAATGTLPLAAGFVGIVPALGMLVPEIDGQEPLKLTWIQGIQWSLAVAFFG